MSAGERMCTRTAGVCASVCVRACVIAYDTRVKNSCTWSKVLMPLTVSWENMFDASSCYHYVIAFVCCDVGEQKPINVEVTPRPMLCMCPASLINIVIFIVAGFESNGLVSDHTE